MALNVFKVGDIIKGLTDNRYGVTTEEMTKGKVISVNNKKYEMTVRVLEHTNSKEVGEVYLVENNDTRFTYANTDFNLKIITDGCIVTLDNGDRLMYNKEDNYFAELDYNEDNGLCEMDDLHSNGIVDDYDSHRIVKIEKPSGYITTYKREEFKEMTLEEVCKKLGYNVKIIKGEE